MPNRVYVLVACIFLGILIAIAFGQLNWSYAVGPGEGANVQPPVSSPISPPPGAHAWLPDAIPKGVPDPAKFNVNSIAQCWFDPINEDFGVQCTMTFTFCQDVTSPSCILYMWIFCRNRLVYWGGHSHGQSGQQRGFFGLPFDLEYADVPVVTLFATVNVGNAPPPPAHPAVTPAMLNFKSRNRFGVCYLGPGPLPGATPIPKNRGEPFR
jgi:hypothetical protein